MKKITWDKDFIRKEWSGIHYFDGLVKSAEEKFWKDGDVICEVVLNGQSLSEKEEGLYSQLKISEIQKIEFFVSNQKELVNKNISSLTESVRELILLCEVYVENSYKGQRDNKYEDFICIVQSMEIIFDNLRLLKVSLQTTIQPHLVLWSELEDSTKTIVKHLVQAFDNQDQQLIRDVLDYELLDNLDKWLDLLTNKINI